MNASCEKEWTRKFISESFPATFINGPLKKHRENVLFDRERALLPATQPYAEALKQIKNNDNEIANIFKMINDLNRRRNDLAIRQRHLKENPLHAVETGDENVTGDNDKQRRRQFIKACPLDECRGFLSSQWKCGLCETWTCPDCNIIIGKSKDAPHTCDPDNIESAKMLKAETKPCPKCAASIFKIDGCDQMWCTQCHTAFSWNTGRIETKIHNPHYYEWMRRTQGSVPRDPLDIQYHNGGHDCAEANVGPRMIRILHTILLNKNRKDDGLSDLYSSKISWMIRNIVHYREVVIRDTNNDYEEKNKHTNLTNFSLFKMTLLQPFNYEV
jgi:ribosomal protein S27AE